MAKKRTAKKTPTKKRAYTQAPVAVDPGVQCVHCQAINYKWQGRVLHSYPNGNRRLRCEHCELPFIVRSVPSAIKC